MGMVKLDNTEPEFTQVEVKVLQELIRDRQWWDEALKRAKRIGIIAGAVFAGLAMLAAWWPWITRVVQFFIKDVPIE